VADERDVETAPFEVTADDVEHERSAAVPDVRHFVDRRTAHVDRHAAGIAGNELDLLARERVVQPDHVVSTLSSSATAHTATPSPRPIAPRPSPRFGFTDTRFCAPGSGKSGTSAWYRLSVMVGTCGASVGRSAATTTSTFPSRQPLAATRPATSRSNRIDEASR